jgi:hypothetical protein
MKNSFGKVAVIACSCLITCWGNPLGAKDFPNICDQDPVVQFSGEGAYCFFSLSSYSYPIRIANVSGGTLISFKTTMNPLPLISFEGRANDYFIYSVTSHDAFTHSHTVQPKGETFLDENIEIQFTSTDVGCISGDSTKIAVFDGEIQFQHLAPMPLSTADGGLTFFDSD